eukprot:SAG11_NODE_542_length_8640_cov_5.667603_14_plen_40_part_01
MSAAAPPPAAAAGSLRLALLAAEPSLLRPELLDFGARKSS